MKLSLSTGSLYVYPLRTVCHMAHTAGFDGVEVTVNPEAILRGGQAIRRLVEAEGLVLYSVHPTVVPLPGWQQRRDGLDRTIRLAQAAEADLIVIHTPRTETLESGQGLAFRDEIEAWQKRLAGGKLRLAIENKAVRREADRHYVLTPLDRLRAFADRYDLGLVLDTAHAGLAGEDLLQARRVFDERLVNLHLSDLGGGPPGHSLSLLQKLSAEHRFPGVGCLPLAELIADLEGCGYAGPLTLEVSPIDLRLWWPPAVRRRLVRAVAWMRQAAATPQPAARP
jgi:sugar phosphate isomerase/epimerase